MWHILRISCNSLNVHTYKTKRNKVQSVAKSTDPNSNFLHPTFNRSKCLTILFRLCGMFTLKVGIPLQPLPFMALIQLGLSILNTK